MASLCARIWSTWRASSSAWPCSHQNLQVAQTRSSAIPGLIPPDQPGQRGAEVVAPHLQPVEPGQLPGAVQLGFGGLGQGQEVGGMPVVHVPPVSAVPQAFQGVLPDGLEQAEPGLLLAGLHPDQAAVHQRAERVHHRSPDGVTADGRDGGQAEAPGEYREPGEQRLFVGGKQAEAPVQRVPQGPLPFGQVTRPGGQQAHPVIEPREQRARRQQPDPGGGQLDGQRQAVQPAADLGDELGIVAWSARSPAPRRGRGPRTGGPRRPSPPAPGAGRRNRKRRHYELVFAAEPQHGPAGDQDH